MKTLGSTNRSRRNSIDNSIVTGTGEEEEKETNNFENKESVRSYFERLLSGMVGRVLNTITIVLCCSSFLLYILYTYNVDVGLYFEYVDWVVVFYFLLEFIARFYVAQNKIIFLSSINTAVDLYTIGVPLVFLFLDFHGKKDNLFYQTSVVFRFFRFVRYIHRWFQTGQDEVNSQLVKIFLTVFNLILTTAGLVLAIENPYRQKWIDQNREVCSDPDYGLVLFKCKVSILYYHSAVYFIVVTLATVGYGDIYPISEVGRACVVAFIILALVLLPEQTNELIRLIGTQSVYARNVYKHQTEVPHIIVCGDIDITSFKNFCKELFHPDHGNNDKNAVILQYHLPSIDMELFLRNPRYEMYLTYLKGNALEKKDLDRAAASKAASCVVMTCKQHKNADEIDHRNILTGIAIKKYALSQNVRNFKFCIQLIKPESKKHFYSSMASSYNDQIIVVEEIKMNLVAKSCFCPGIISLLGNLVRSSGDQEFQRYRKKWMKEYTVGMGHEIYRTKLSTKFERKKFNELAAFIYKEFKGILFCLEMKVDNYAMVILNPGDFEIPDVVKNDIHAYLICEDKKVADEIAYFEMTQEEIAEAAKYVHSNESENSDKDDNSADDALLSLIDAGDAKNDSQEAEEEDYLESDYELLESPLSLLSCTRINLRNQVNDHIIICGLHPSIYYFILPLRARYLIYHKPIVILNPEPPSNEVWESINRFPNLSYIKGSPKNLEDLYRANISNANKAIIFANTEKHGEDVDMSDSETTLIYKALKRAHPGVQVIVEIVNTNNLKYLDSSHQTQDDIAPKHSKLNLFNLNERSRNLEEDIELDPLYAAGEIYVSSIIDTLTCQAYYNPHIVTVFQQILNGGRKSNMIMLGITEQTQLKQSNLYQMDVPKDLLNETFGDLFNKMTLEEKIIPLGLYRQSGATDNAQSYVLTNPPENIKLTHRDKIFVLALDYPEPVKNEDETKTSKLRTEAANQSTHVVAPAHDEADDKNKLNTAMAGHDQYTLNIDYESLNINSATYKVFRDLDSNVAVLEKEFKGLEHNLEEQKKHIISKIRTIIRSELLNSAKI